MVRAMVQLTEEQMKALKALAKARKTSVARLVRNSVAQYILNAPTEPSYEEKRKRAPEFNVTADRRQLSLVDCSSFETMRRLGIKKVFSFGEHFREHDFEVIP